MERNAVPGIKGGEAGWRGKTKKIRKKKTLYLGS